MKKTTYLSLFTIMLFMCINTAVAQKAPISSKSFSIKKGTETQTGQLIEDYLTRILHFKGSDEKGLFIGSFDDMYYSRDSVFKNIYSIDFSITSSVPSGKVNIDYRINQIRRTTIICDRTQKKTTETTQLNQDVKDAAIKAFDELTECLRKYIKTGEETIPTLDYRPSWYPLNYILEDKAVSYYTVITSDKGLSKEALYKIFENYFTYAYRSGKAVIENKSAEECSIIAKGVYPKIHHYYGWCTEDYDAPHVVSIQCRDGRVRVTITVSNYDIHRSGSKWAPNGLFTRNIAEYEPFGKESDGEMTECLQKLEIWILEQFAEMKKVIEEGNNAVEALDDW